MPDGVVVLELDDAPLSLELPGHGDYIGRLVACAAHLPLRALDDAPAICCSVEADDDSLTLEVDPERRWSDGAPVTARDVLAGLGRAVKAPYWRQVLAQVSKVSARGAHTVRLSLRGPAGHLPAALTSIELSPAAPRPGLASGPYLRVHSQEPDCLMFERNSHFSGADHGRPGLGFRVNRTPALSPELFNSRAVDVSSNTGFPLDRLGEYAGTPLLCVEPSGIFAQIEFSPEANAPWRSAAARTALCNALDRSGACSGLAPSWVPAESFGPEGAFTLPPHRLPSSPGPRPPELAGAPLRVLYNPYYPNRELLDAVLAQWSELGVVGVPVPVPFDEASPPPHDAYLRLRTATFPHVAALVYLFAWSLSGDGHPTQPLFDAAHDPSDGGTGRAASALVDRLLTSVPAIPVAHLRSVYLKRPEVGGLSFSTTGHFRFDRLVHRGPP
ncbi:MAG: ABC transporter substrate-binding protein [Myxococcota bacterium]